tara:strand:- start:435 stop:650 length:216 start_codon:yes stop_codon:yes gene_type:complete
MNQKIELQSKGSLIQTSLAKSKDMYDLPTRRAALHPQASLKDKVVRSVRASASGQTLPEYEERLRSMGVQF